MQNQNKYEDEQLGMLTETGLLVIASNSLGVV
jgi:hypothetical protein